MLLKRAEETPKKALPRLNPGTFGANAGRLVPAESTGWSAWLIRKFIDPQANFVFASDPPSRSDLIPFDMVDVEFSHQGDRCTFETLTYRFAIDDKPVHKIGEMIHDADLDDAKFQRVECIGIDRVLKGWGKSGMRDDEILAGGFKCFDGLYEFLQRR